MGDRFNLNYGFHFVKIYMFGLGHISIEEYFPMNNVYMRCASLSSWG